MPQRLSPPPETRRVARQNDTMLLIFDCDGVLLDTETINAAIDVEILNALGHSVSRQEILDRFAGVSLRQTWRTLSNELGFVLTSGLMQLIEDRYGEEHNKGLPVVHGTTDTLSCLSTLNAKYCVASSTERGRLIRNLTQCGLHDLFHPNIFSTSEVRWGKPAPDIFLHAAATMGFDPATSTVIEDSVAGCEAGIAAGMDVIGFAGAGHSTKHLSDRLRAAGASTICHSMSALTNLLLSRVNQH